MTVNGDEQNEERPNKSRWHLVVALLGAVMALAASASFARRPPQECVCNETAPSESHHKDRPLYWVYGQHSDVDDKGGIMKHVHLVLNRVGLAQADADADWDLLWSHDFPFRSLYPRLRQLRRGQLVNHFPGTGYITNKVDFAVTPSPFIPRAFKLPDEVDAFAAYAQSRPDAVFVRKHNQHRGVSIKSAKDILSVVKDDTETFVQEYVTRPFLVDGHKFDIGVYTVLTSVDPLRVYIYKGDILFRYCPAKYYPFDPLELDKYVIGDDYLPTWEVPSLAPYYTAMGYGMKDSFDAYVKSRGKDPQVIWDQVDDFMREIFKKKESHIIAGLKNYRSGSNFFEMMRFDFVIDEDLKLYALEANMSPNLSSAHFPPNQLLYEQVLYNVLSLVGVAKYIRGFSFVDRSASETSMQAADKNIAVWADECRRDVCISTCDGICAVCRHCLTPSQRQFLVKTYTEQMNRNDCRRVYPKPLIQGMKSDDVNVVDLSANDALLRMWLQGKCNKDITWCS